ncbi:MAG: Uma2 family endonuclease [Mojavia pulchra JT2-VF2]|jgi:Uma2 family endonuclease|uniref:Uma2 family endonuclease n=1 Tax=Mojavia pulchra JT2-VF2 TaxID=287848 RepID=A0A951PVB6_9NOST|nr:Uma2 family endonuclease [Mojavia pulchra JT2-VF2]
MLANAATYEVTWEKLPDDFVLDDQPVDNINQPPLAAALTESLELAGRLPSNALTLTHYGICATLNGQFVVKATDWGYVPSIRVPRAEVKRSYTPRLQGDIPAIVMELISDTEGGEYSSKPTYPPGKWFYYEQVLQVPNYAIFEPDEGVLEVYQRDDSGRYQLQSPDANQRYWIAEMNLFLGVWQGSRENRTGYCLRWWGDRGELLLWGSELAIKERQEKNAVQQQLKQERQRAEQERQRAEKLVAQLKALGVEPET